MYKCTKKVHEKIKILGLRKVSFRRLTLRTRATQSCQNIILNRVVPRVAPRPFLEPAPSHWIRNCKSRIEATDRKRYQKRHK